MDIEVTALFCALGGGAFGAAIGGQPAFIFTGFAIVIGVAAELAGADYDFLVQVAFGPIFGPHVAFAGGVAAVAYAARRGQMESGRDIATPVTVTGAPDALLVGAVFGAGGYLLNQVLATVIDGATLTDTVAFTVTVSGIASRLIFGRSGLFGNITQDVRERGRMSVSSDAVWVGHQAGLAQTVVLGAAAGLIASYLMVSIAGVDAELASTVRTAVFGFSALSLLMLQFGQPGPVTHHMTLSASVATSTILLAGGSEGVAMALGVATGVGAALVAELSARVFLIHGDTHIDPPAMSIFIMTSFVLLCDAVF